MMVKVFKKPSQQAELYQSYDRLLKLWNVDVDEIDINTSYGSTHVITCGNPENKPLILFHGVGDNSALMWIYNARALSEHFYVIAVDTIGGPGKSKTNENYNKSFDQIKWIDQLLSYFSFDIVSICGVSNGAYLTQLYSIKRKERVAKAVCMAGSLFVDGQKDIKWKMMKVFLPEALFPTPNNAKKLVRKLTGDNYRAFTDNKVLMEHYTLLLKSFNNQAMFYHKMIAFSKEEFASIKDKITFFIGKKDVLAYSEEAIQDFTANQIPYKEFEIVGHAINHEIPNEINRELLSFLNVAHVSV